MDRRKGRERHVIVKEMKTEREANVDRKKEVSRKGRQTNTSRRKRKEGNKDGKRENERKKCSYQNCNTVLPSVRDRCFGPTATQ